jgi:flavin reductase (DIM6/NTAB) family NADH-FMN oxidoreductase RutF
MRSPLERPQSLAEIGAFSRVVRLVARPVVVVTVEHAGQRRAMTAGSFGPLSWAVPTVCVNFADDAQTLVLIREATHFVVNVLRDDQVELSERLSRVDLDAEEQVHDLDIREAGSGAHVLPGIIGALECRKTTVVPVVDHTLVIGTVERAYPGLDGNPLVTRDGRYHGLGPVLGEVNFVRRA